MSQTPPPFNPPPQAYDSPVLRTMPSRPVSVTVIAIIVIVFAAIALLCSPFSLIPYYFKTAGQRPNVVMDLMTGNSILRTWAIVSMVVGMIVAGINLYAAIGSLKLKPSARKLMVAMAAIQLVLILINLGVIIFVMMPPMMDIIRSTTDPAARAGAIGGLIGALVWPLIGCILPGLTLYFFQTPYVVEAFERDQSAWNTI